MAFILRNLAAIAWIAGVPSLAAAQTLMHPALSVEVVATGESMVNSLGLAELEQLALSRNPTLAQARAQVSISRGKALQAGLYPNPIVGYAAEQIGADGTAGEFHGAFVEQQIITGGKLRLSRAKYAQEARQAELQSLAQQYRILSSVRLAFYHTLAHKQRLRLRSQILQNWEEIHVTVGELVNVGQANRADLLQARVQLQRADASRQAAERRYHAAWEELAAVIGMPDMTPSGLDGELDIDRAAPIDRTAALNNLLVCSPEILFARAEVDRDRLSLQRERVEPIPNINVRAESGYNFDSEDTVAGFEVGFRLPVFDKNQGTIAQARSELSRAEAEVARIELMLRKRFAQAFAEYETAVLLVNTYRDETLPLAEEVYRLYLESFQQRRAAWPQVLDAQREYYELYEDYLDSLVDARRAETQITSMFLEDGLSEPPTPRPEGHRDTTPRPR